MKNSDATYSRRLTQNERLYTIAERLHPPFVMQFVLKGAGIIEPGKLQESLIKLCEHLPVLTLRRDRNHWAQAAGPRLSIHQSVLPNDLNDGFFHSKINSAAGPCIEFHLFTGGQPAIVMRVLHSLMDGTAAVTVLEMLSGLMADKNVTQLHEFPSDEKFKTERGIEERGVDVSFKRAWKGLNRSESSGIFNSGVIRSSARVDTISALVSLWYAKYTHAPGRFLIPVNMRRHRENELILGNFSSPVYLSVDPKDQLEDIAAKLLTMIGNREELKSSRMDKYARFIPDFVLRFVFTRIAKQSRQTGLYPLSGFISDLGYIDLDKLSFSRFNATDFFSIPVYTPLLPFCWISCSHKNGTRGVFTVDSGVDVLHIQNDLEKFISGNMIHSPEISSREVNLRMIEELRMIWADALTITENVVQPNLTFRELGGESIALLLIVDACCKKYSVKNGTAFMTDVAKQSGALTLVSMSELINKHK